MLLVCLLYEWKGRSDGFAHHALFKRNRNYPIALVAIGAEGVVFYLLNNQYSGQVFALWSTDAVISAFYIMLVPASQLSPGCADC